MHVVMIVMSDVLNDVRLRREATTLRTAGWRVTIIGDRRPPAGEPIPGVTVRFARESEHRSEVRRRRSLPATVRWALLPHHRQRQQRAFVRRAAELLTSTDPYDVLHLHDLTGLRAGAAALRRTPSIYDAHECWTGRRLEGRPEPFRRLLDRRFERSSGAQCRAVITVSPGIAEWLQSTYGWRDVTVVRNTFPSTPYRAPTTARGLLYAGRIDGKRDLDTLRSAAHDLRDLRITCIGPDDGTAERLRGALEVRSPVSVDDLDALYRHHGLAVVPLAAGSRNHDLALPNKLFQAVRAGVPVVAADLPEIRRVVQGYDIGTLYRPGSAEDLVRAVRDAMARYAELVRNVEVARPSLSWDGDEVSLLRVYDRLTGA